MMAPAQFLMALLFDPVLPSGEPNGVSIFFYLVIVSIFVLGVIEQKYGRA